MQTSVLHRKAVNGDTSSSSSSQAPDATMSKVSSTTTTNGSSSSISSRGTRRRKTSTLSTSSSKSGTVPTRRIRRKRLQGGRGNNASVLNEFALLDRWSLFQLIIATLVLTLLSCAVGYRVYVGMNQEGDDSNHQQKQRLRKDEPSAEQISSSPPPPPAGLWERFVGKSNRQPTYRHSDWMRGVGDRSWEYSELRRKYDELLPMEDTARMLDFASKLRKRTYRPILTAADAGAKRPYDIENCPDHPPKGYPIQFNVLDVLKNWPPDDPTPREYIHRGICVFDYETESHKAHNYRSAEVPFVIRDDPMVLRTVERWNQPDYMLQLLGSVPHRTEYSANNHFMYWTNPSNQRKKKNGRRTKEEINESRRNLKKRGLAPDGRGIGSVESLHIGMDEKGSKEKIKRKDALPQDWSPPTQMLRMPYAEWLGHANITDDSKLGPENPHWYYRLIGCGHMSDGNCDKDSSEYLFDELPFFQPRDGLLYMVQPGRQKGIHCRFGMKGVIAENHFDGSRNMIAVFGGERRYILSHPNQCKNLALLPKGHPSARHSAVDWSDPDLESYPQFAHAEVNEIILQAGDVLYLPTNWFHFIVSLELNFQCNTRSGINNDYMDVIRECGF